MAARMAGRVCPLVNDDPSLTEPWCTFPEGIVFMLPVADKEGKGVRRCPQTEGSGVWKKNALFREKKMLWLEFRNK